MESIKPATVIVKAKKAPKPVDWDAVKAAAKVEVEVEPAPETPSPAEVAPAPTPDPAEAYDDTELLEDLFTEIRLLCTVRIDDIFVELLEQTERAEIIARHYAMTTSAVESIETELKKRKAQVYLECRNHPTRKYAEKEIDATRDTDPIVNHLRQQRGTAKAMQNYTKDMSQAFREGRATMLVNLKKLLDAEANVKA